MSRRLPPALAVAVAVLAVSAAPAIAQQATRADEATALPPGEPAAEPQTSLPDIEDEVMCPVCGVTLELATEAPQAQQQREFIRELIAEGLTKDEIKDRLVAELGPEVLAIPDDEGFDLAAWLVPAAAILAAGIAIFVGLWRWRGGGPGGGVGPGGSAEPRSEGVDPADAKRLEADLERYEL
jgi:cytochrome c-type biogenesis protein CcmH